MVIYHRDWSGKKVIVGSTINAWDPTVATLPDLSTMISKTFVNEVDIRKIKQGQTVKVGLDAFPEKKLTGKVVSVANVGEQLPNSDSKVFEVNILINESDTTLRPAMTTSNLVLTGSVKDALFIPLEAVHTQGDSLTYVYRMDGGGLVRQQVKLGQTNENEVVVLDGLKENQEVYLSVPKDADRKELVLLPKAKPGTSSKPSTPAPKTPANLTSR
jgi:multidrug efflux pump subunit AcrA (membrane-fusion protein)